jgi:hypothetical protein
MGHDKTTTKGESMEMETSKLLQRTEKKKTRRRTTSFSFKGRTSTDR